MLSHKKRFVIIEGMHRSGTSFLARALNLAGVYLGDLESLTSHEWNPLADNLKGHWEHKKILELTEKTLSNNNGTWDNVPEKIQISKKLGTEIKNTLLELESHTSLANGFKDPRIGLCLDSWLPYLPKNFLIIGIFRDPIKVAESLKKRNNLDIHKSLDLWKIYNQKLLEHLEKNNGFLINFDWPTEKLLSELKTIFEKLGLDKDIDLSEWYSKELLHADKSYNANQPLSDELQTLYSKLQQKAKLNNKVKIKKSPLSMREYSLIIQNRLQDIHGQGKYFKKIKNNLEKELKTKDERIINLQKEFDERSKWALELNDLVKEKDETIINLQKEFDERSKWAKSFDEKAAKAESEFKKAQDDLSSAESKLQEKESEFKKAQDDLSLINKQLQFAEEQFSMAQDELISTESKLQQTEDVLSTKEAELQHTQDVLSTKEAELQDVQGNLFVKQNELDDLKHSILFKIPFKIARGLDKTFPQGTKRGEALRLLRMSLLISKNEGNEALLDAVKEKTKRQRFLKRKKKNYLKKFDYSKPLKTEQINKTFNLIQGTKNKKLDPKLRKFLQTDYSDILNLSRFPKVSIIIPTYNQVDFLRKNISIIEKKTTYKNYEIIIVTNNTDENSEMRKFLKNSKHQVCIFQDEYSFGEMNNFASKRADGEFLLFLNDDVEIISPNWLEAMLKLAIQDRVGAVGGKLVFPNGKLQEAGGIVWKDGIIWNYGRNTNPNDPSFNFVRNVDYCSGSCLLINKELFEKLGKFDIQYKPAYCEDTDICLALQKEGFKVLFQPLATLIHHEGKTSGTDLKSGIKSYQIQNQKKFRKKWHEFLSSRLNDSPDNAFLERNRKEGINILYIDHYVPEYDKDAGSLLVNYMLSILSYLGHKVTFWPDNLIKSEPYTSNLQQKGIEVIYGENRFESFIKKHGNDFQICITTRAHIAPKYIDMVKKYASKCKIIYDTVDLHFLREFREAELKKNSNNLSRAKDTSEIEFEIFQKSDIVIVKSMEEANLLLKQVPSLTVSVIPTFEIPPKEFPPFKSRKDMLFLGGFQHPPNIDSLEYLIKTLYPKIKEKLPNEKLYVIGSNPTQKVIDMCSKTDGVVFLGYVKNIDSYLKKCRLLLAPIRYGAGVKGKITQSMAYGLVTITTPIGAEGITSDGEEFLIIANTDEQFIEKTISTYNNEELWTKLSLTSRKSSEENFSPEYIKSTLEKILSKLFN